MDELVRGSDMFRNRSLFYRLDEQKNVLPADTLEDAFFTSSERIVKQENLIVGEQHIFVSTVFLGMDHGYGNENPVVFETLIEGEDNIGGINTFLTRYCTWAEAEKGHQAVVAYLQNFNNLPSLESPQEQIAPD